MCLLHKALLRLFISEAFDLTVIYVTISLLRQVIRRYLTDQCRGELIRIICTVILRVIDPLSYLCCRIIIFLCDIRACLSLIFLVVQLILADCRVVLVDQVRDLPVFQLVILERC